MLDAVTGREWANAVTGIERPKPKSSRSPTTWSAAPSASWAAAAAIGALATAVNRDLREPALRRSAGAVLCRRRRRLSVSSTPSATGSSTAASRAVISSAAPARSRGCRTQSQRYSAGPMRHTSSSTRRDVAQRLDRQREPESQRGIHQVNAALWGVSPGFDSSDAGFTFAADRAGMHAVYQWSNPKVTRYARRRFFAVAKWYTWNFARELQGDGVHLFGNMELKNYWTVFANVGLFRSAQDDRATRGGPSMLQPSAHNESIGIESDGRKPVSVGLQHQQPAATRLADGAGDWGSTSATGRPRRSRFPPVRTSSAPTPCRSTSTPSSDPVAADTLVPATCSRPSIRRSSACRRGSTT